MAWKPDYIELDELKTYLRIPLDDTQDDDELAINITAASRAVDDHCNRQFGVAAGPVERTYQAWYNAGRALWMVEIDDLMSTVGVTIEVTDVGTVTDYTLEPSNAAADGKPWERLVIGLGSSVQPSGYWPYRLEVVMSALWGWTTTPPSVTLATRLQASRLGIRRDSPYGVAGSPDSGTEMRLLAKLDPDVAVALRGFRRPRAVG